MTDLTLAQQSPEFNQSLAFELFDSDEDFPIDFEHAWVWLGFGVKGNAKDSFFRLNFVEGEDYYVSPEKIFHGQQGGRPTHSIALSVDCFKSWAMMAKTPQGNAVRKYFLQCEKIVRKQMATQIAQQATQLADLAEQVETLSFENEEFIKKIADIQVRQSVTKSDVADLRINFEGTTESISRLDTAKTGTLELMEDYRAEFKQEQEYFDDLCERVAKLEKAAKKPAKKRTAAKKTTKKAGGASTSTSVSQVTEVDDQEDDKGFYYDQDEELLDDDADDDDIDLEAEEIEAISRLQIGR